MSIVRIGLPDDVDGVMKLALAACEENGVVEPDTNELLQDIWPALNVHLGVMGVIGPVGGELEGAVLLRIGKPWYSNLKVLEEKAIFVQEKYRKGSVRRAQLLIEFSKGMSDKLDLPLLIGVLSNQRTRAKVRMYERIFGEPSGAFFLYNAKTGNWKDNPVDASMESEYSVTEH